MTEVLDTPPTRTRPPTEIIAVAVLVLFLGLLFKAHCYLDGGWDSGEQYTIGCYTDVVPFWTGRGVAAGDVPYVDSPLEYPVLTGVQIWIEGAISRALVGPDASALMFLGVVTLVNAALAVGILLVLHRMGVPRSRLWWWALAPAIVLYVGHNWDLLAMFLVVLAIHRHRRGDAIGAGVAVGLGTAAKLFPALLLPLLLLTHLRRREIGRFVATGVAAVIAWLVVNLPFAVIAPQRWAEFYTFSQERVGTFAATWTILQDLGVLTTSVEQRNLYGTLAFALGAVVIVLASWRRHRGRVSGSEPAGGDSWRVRASGSEPAGGDRWEWVLITPVVAWFLLTNKVWSPQFDLWLIPLLVLTARRMWPLAAFAVTDILVYWLEFWWLARLAEFTPSASFEALAAAAALRAIVLVVIIVLAVRDQRPSWMAPATEDAPATEPVGAESR